MDERAHLLKRLKVRAGSVHLRNQVFVFLVHPTEVVHSALLYALDELAVGVAYADEVYLVVCFEQWRYHLVDLEDERLNLELPLQDLLGSLDHEPIHFHLVVHLMVQFIFNRVALHDQVFKAEEQLRGLFDEREEYRARALCVVDFYLQVLKGIFDVVVGGFEFVLLDGLPGDGDDGIKMGMEIVVKYEFEVDCLEVWDFGLEVGEDEREKLFPVDLLEVLH